MFTGIVTDVGALVDVERDNEDARMRFSTHLDLEDCAIGASICCAGVCLTVIAKDAEEGWFEADVSGETLARTTLGDWQPGQRVNFERSLKLGDEMGGHIVSGHVDAVATVAETAEDGDSLRVVLSAPRELAPFVSEKGSVALDGCSLTVNLVEDRPDEVRFSVNLIPHTQSVTTFDALAPGARLNMEVDMFARYVARIAAVSRG